VRIAASGVVPAAPEAVFRFLSKLENHWRLADRWIEVLETGDSSGRVRMRGPLGLRRTAHTRVEDAEPDHLMHGTAELSGGTVAQIAWELNEDAGGTGVRLSADLERASLPDRLVLALGGAAWMRRRFERILETLAGEFG
jgi:Polyketide cyclase / dehydrase and lipid transport